MHVWLEPQCLDCIDKHLTKSMCRMEEALAIAEEKAHEGMDGYPARYKIMGELDTAKKYCDQWPELGQMLIDAKEQFKTTGILPDWDKLALTTGKIVMGDKPLDVSAYRIRFKIIGNLALAEEHSVKWPELHKAIRAERKALQEKGTMPDWGVLARISAETWARETTEAPP